MRLMQPCRLSVHLSPPNNFQTHWHISMQVLRGEAEDLEIIMFLQVLWKSVIAQR